MARKYRTKIREKDAVEVRVNIDSLEDYKDAYLIICNNAREYPDTFMKVWNNSSNSIFVLTTPDSREAIEDFLEQFGKVATRETVAVYVDVSCEYDDFDKDYIISEYVFGEID